MSGMTCNVSIAVATIALVSVTGTSFAADAFGTDSARELSAELATVAHSQPLMAQNDPAAAVVAGQGEAGATGATGATGASGTAGATGTAGAAQPADAASIVPEQAERFGAKNSLRLAFEGDWIYNWGEANQAQGRVGLQWFVFDNVELAIYGTLNYVWQPREDAFGGGFDMQLRWHFISEQDWSVFAEVGGGILGTTEPVPANGSDFNFTPNVGFGATYAINPTTRLYAGVRWFHISNAGLYAKNPGRDSSSVWLGLSFKL